MTDDKPIKYNQYLEKLLKDTSEESEGMYLLHRFSYSKYYTINICFIIPIILLSSLIGLLSSINFWIYQQYMISALAVVITIIKSISGLFMFEQRSENHRKTSLEYQKLSNLIKLQLSLEREIRINPKDLLNILENQLQNIHDSEPDITKDIVTIFNKKYYKYNDIKKPSIANGLTKVNINNRNRQIVDTHENELEVLVENNNNNLQPIENNNV